MKAKHDGWISDLIQRHRGQMAVLGLILLIGIVAIASIGILLVASQSTDNVQQQAETDRVEQSFIQMSKELETASSSQDVSRAMELGLDNNQGSTDITDEGYIRIYLNGKEIEGNLGTIEYTSGDGSKISYQGGGVWRGTGSDSLPVSTPSFNFKNDSATLSIISVSGGQNSLDDDMIATTQSSNFLASNSTNDQVIIEIESEYHGGWANYFENEVAEATVVDDGSDDGVVVVTFGEDEEPTDGFNLFERGVVSHGQITVTGGPNIDGDLAATEDITVAHWLEDDFDYYPNQSIEAETYNDLIENKVQNGYGEEWQPICTGEGDNWDCEFEGGNTYYIDDVDFGHGGNNGHFDVGDGDITLVVDGDFKIEEGNDIRVYNANEGNSLYVYTNGDIEVMGDSSICPYTESQDEVNEYSAPCDTENLHSSSIQMYGTTDTEINLGEGAHIEGVIAAPRESSNCDSCSSGLGGASVYGAIHGGAIDIGEGFTFEYDDSLSELHLPTEIANIGGSNPDNSTYVTAVNHDVHISDN